MKRFTKQKLQQLPPFVPEWTGNREAIAGLLEAADPGPGIARASAGAGSLPVMQGCFPPTWPMQPEPGER